jgi:hypothetical protein
MEAFNMAEVKNVGTVDGVIRIILGIASLATIACHFLFHPCLPLWAIVILFILVPFFLKTGITKVCPIMKALGISTHKEK